MFLFYFKKFKAAERMAKKIDKNMNKKTNPIWNTKKISIIYMLFIFCLGILSATLSEGIIFASCLLLVFLTTNTIAKTYYCFLLFIFKKKIWKLYIKGKSQESFSYYSFLNSNAFFLFNVNPVYRMANLFNIVIVSSTTQFLGKSFGIMSYITIFLILFILVACLILSIKSIQDMALNDFHSSLLNNRMHSAKQVSLKRERWQAYIALKEKGCLKNTNILIEKEKSGNFSKTNRL